MMTLGNTGGKLNSGGHQNVRGQVHTLSVVTSREYLTATSVEQPGAPTSNANRARALALAQGATCAMTDRYGIWMACTGLNLRPSVSRYVVIM